MLTLQELKEGVAELNGERGAAGRGRQPPRAYWGSGFIQNQ